MKNILTSILLTVVILSACSSESTTRSVSTGEIVFVSPHEGKWAIYTLQTDGTELKK